MHEHLDIARQRFAHDNYAGTLGIVLDDLTHDTIRMHMQLRDDMLNWFSRVHGGAIYALADAAFSVLANNSNNLAVCNHIPYLDLSALKFCATSAADNTVL